MYVLLRCYETQDELSVTETKVYFVESQTYEMLANFRENHLTPSDPELATQLECVRKRIGKTFNHQSHINEVIGHWVRAHGRPDGNVTTWSCTLF